MAPYTVTPTHCFVWIERGKFNLLDADLHKLPRKGWVTTDDGGISNGEYRLDFAEGSQPPDPYLYNFGNLRKM